MGVGTPAEENPSNAVLRTEGLAPGSTSRTGKKS